MTARQRALLAFIGEYHARHGYGPTVREMGDAIGLRAKSSVARQLIILRRDGYIERIAIGARCHYLTGKRVE